jgi:hypothetical protein
MEMKLLLENFKKFSTLTEEQLIVEGRIDDARKKYPALNKPQEDLDGKTLLDILIDADPSGNQKYLMGAARLTVGLLDDLGYMETGETDRARAAVQNFAELIQRYHKLMPFIRDQDAKFKDINAIKAYHILRAVIDRAAQKSAAKEQEKAREEETKKVAVKGTEFVADTPYHKVVRPLTKEGSCYFGRQTRWCISAERSANYFDEYTGKGKAFFFLLAKNKNVEDAFKKIAVVIDDRGNFEEYYDAPDDEMTYQEFVRAVRQTMIGFDLDNHIQAWVFGEPYDRDKIMKAAEILGVSEYINNDEIAIENAVEMIDDEVIEYISDLEVKAGESVTATPAGIPFYKYEEILDKFPFEKMRVDIEEPDYSGYETITLDVGGTIDINDYLEGSGWEWKPGVEEELGDEHEQDVVDAVYNALEYAGFDVYGGTVEQDYDDLEQVHFSIRYTAEHDIDKLDVFEVMLEDLLNVDKEIRGETFGKNIISSLEGDELIYNPELEKQKAEEEADEKFKASKDADYFASRQEREKQMKLALQERKFRILIKKS